MAEQAEKAFVKTFLNTLSSQRIIYADDYQQPSELSLKRVPVLPIPVPPPPERKIRLETSLSSDATSTSGSKTALISVTFKSPKPAASFSLSVYPTDTVSDIKVKLAAQPTAPPADVQRFLYKGKAFSDNKLLKEYNIKDGDTISLIVKPGYNWDPAAAAPQTTPTMTSPSPSNPNIFGSGSLDPGARSRQRHQRIPSVVLSPSPSNASSGAIEKDITLTLDANTLASPVSNADSLSTFHETVANPEFWAKLMEFLKGEFKTDTDVLQAFEDFLRATKGSLTASQIAKIRDTLGVIGMAGN